MIKRFYLWLYWLFNKKKLQKAYIKAVEKIKSPKLISCDYINVKKGKIRYLLGFAEYENRTIKRLNLGRQRKNSTMEILL